MAERYNLKHGLTPLKAAVKGLGGRVIDKRTTLGKALLHWKQGIVQDLGGEENVSKQQQTIIDLAVSTKLMVDSLDAWILTQKSLVLHRKKAVIPVVLQRQQLADSLANYMGKLGLARRARHTSLKDFIEEASNGEGPG